MSLVNSPAFNTALGARIRGARIFAKLSQGALGGAIGVSFQQIQKYELGKDRVSAEALARIAEATGRPIGEFFAAADEAATPTDNVLPISVAALRRGQAVAAAIEVLEPAARRHLLGLLGLLPRAGAPAVEPAEAPTSDPVREAA